MRVRCVHCGKEETWGVNDDTLLPVRYYSCLKCEDATHSVLAELITVIIPKYALEESLKILGPDITRVTACLVYKEEIARGSSEELMRYAFDTFQRDREKADHFYRIIKAFQEERKISERNQE